MFAFETEIRVLMLMFPINSVGCKIVPHNTWPSAPLDVPIIGLKELPEST